MGRDRHLVGAECRHLGARGYTEVTCDCGNDGVLVLAWGFLVDRGAGWYLGRLFHRSIVYWRGWYVIHRRLVENVEPFSGSSSRSTRAGGSSSADAGAYMVGEGRFTARCASVALLATTLPVVTKVNVAVLVANPAVALVTTV